MGFIRVIAVVVDDGALLRVVVDVIVAVVGRHHNRFQRNR